MANAPVLAHFDPSKMTEVRTDACDKGLGGILVQYPDENSKYAQVIEYASRTLTKAEKNYSTTEKELLAVVFSVYKFRTYLTGIHFKIITDHHALCYIIKKPEISARLARWVLLLQEYSFDVHYKSGEKHLDADCISRFPIRNLSSTMPDIFDLTINSINVLNDFLKLQNEDDHIKSLKLKLIENDKNKNKMPFNIIDGILYKIVKAHGNIKLVPVLPKSLINEIIETFHSDLFGSHLGEFKTIMKIEQRTWWQGMRKDVQEYIKSCYDCLSKKSPKTGPVGLLQPVKVGGPFEKIGIDIFGPLPLSSKRNKYIITSTDYLTKWVEAKAIKDQTAETVADFILLNIICRHGAPYNIISDRGTQFLSEVVENLLKKLGVIHNTSSGYHPQTNGLTEKFNETLANMLSMYVSSNQKDWDRFLPLVVFAFNTSVQVSTKYSPYYLLYGHDPKLPFDINFISTSTMGIDDPDDYACIAKKEFEKSQNLAKQSIIEAQSKMKMR